MRSLYLPLPTHILCHASVPFLPPPLPLLIVKNNSPVVCIPCASPPLRPTVPCCCFASIFVSISGGPSTSELLIAPPPLHSYSTLQAAQVKTTPCSHGEREFCLRTCEQLAGNHNGRFGVHCMLFLSNSTGPAPDGFSKSSLLTAAIDTHDCLTE